VSRREDDPQARGRRTIDHAVSKLFFNIRRPPARPPHPSPLPLRYVASLAAAAAAAAAAPETRRVCDVIAVTSRDDANRHNLRAATGGDRLPAGR